MHFHQIKKRKLLLAQLYNIGGPKVGGADASAYGRRYCKKFATILIKLQWKQERLLCEKQGPTCNIQFSNLQTEEHFLKCNWPALSYLITTPTF